MSRRTALYRHFNRDGDLLYVGISVSAVERLRQHLDGSCWRYEIARMEIEWFSSREEAMSAEKDAIKSENPIFNTSHSDRVSRSTSHAMDEPVSQLVTAVRNADEETVRLCASELDAISVSIRLSGLSQDEIARRMGISKSHVTFLKKGKRALTQAKTKKFIEATGWRLVQQYRELQSALRAAQGKPREMDRIAYIASFSEAA